MILREIQLLSEALWGAVKLDSKFFASISQFVKELSEVNYHNLDKNKIAEIGLFVTHIENFFSKYRDSGNTDIFYIPPRQASSNDDTVKRIVHLHLQLTAMSEDQLQTETDKLKPILQTKKVSLSNVVFIGHGRSKLWARVNLYIHDELGIKTENFESESRTDEQIIDILEGFLSKVTFAVLVLTAEDETKEGGIRARQNVIHEAGLFQGRLGFDKVVLLLQDDVEQLTNLAGLQYIAFSGDKIEQTFYELHRVFKKHGLLT